MDFKNYRRFILRCVRKDVLLVIMRLRNNIMMPKNYNIIKNNIIKKAERQLLNERVRSINSTLEMWQQQRIHVSTALSVC